MAITLTTAMTDLRTRLGEASAAEWADATLLSYIRQAEFWLAAAIARHPNSGRFRYEDQKTLAVSATSIPISGLTKTFSAIRWISLLLPNGYWSDPIPLIDEMDSPAARLSPQVQQGGLVASGYLIRDPNIIIYPSSSSERTFLINYRYQPAPNKAGSADLETPDEYLPMLLTRASHFALADAGQSNTSFDEEAAALLDEINYYESQRSQEGAGESVAMRSGISLW